MKNLYENVKASQVIEINSDEVIEAALTSMDSEQWQVLEDVYQLSLQATEDSLIDGSFHHLITHCNVLVGFDWQRWQRFGDPRNWLETESALLEMVKIASPSDSVRLITVISRWVRFSISSSEETRRMFKNGVVNAALKNILIWRSQEVDNKLLTALTDSFKRLPERFEDSELAYLTLTSKPEHVIRDSVAWSLQSFVNRLDSHLSVSREWKRFDLAILEEIPDGETIGGTRSIPLVLIEFKTFYSFDFSKPSRSANRKFESFDSDVRKLYLAIQNSIAETFTSRVFVFINVHVHGSSKRADQLAATKYVSYFPSEDVDQEQIRKDSNSKLTNYFKNNYGVMPIIISNSSVGECFGFEVIHDYFLLVNPLPKQTNSFEIPISKKTFNSMTSHSA